ncbi:uncharacterized protein LOC127706338 [Mytilus californianus]|uniref:uncharacterized protein LOC127706338 n=1 Tax=Mytilus californianus TaxID=6549 RepID=UPI0022466CBA|nr:uncharacterized protein LOC127706338 [Mytilus californianus]
MNPQEKTKFASFFKKSTDKTSSIWNRKKILQKITNARKLQKNKVSNFETQKQTREGPSRFRAVVHVTKAAVYRAPKLLSINLDTPRVKPEVKTTETTTKLKTNILQGVIDKKHEYDADIPSVNAICCDEKNSVWIGCWNRSPVRSLACNDKIQSKEQYDMPVSDMTVLSSGDILFTKFGDCAIKKLSRKDGTISTFRGCMPLFPEGIHVTRSGDILVTVVDASNFLVTKTTTRKVIKMNDSGKLIKEIEYGSHGLKLFILPYRVTENVNGDICVVNRTGVYLGQIVVLDKEGNLKFTYDGNPSQPCSDFIPMSIACDNNGCIIVADPSDFAIHILDKTGILIQYLNSFKIGISPPLSVCVDQKGCLWVGCMIEEGKQSNTSKVYALC